MIELFESVSDGDNKYVTSVRMFDSRVNKENDGINVYASEWLSTNMSNSGYYMAWYLYLYLCVADICLILYIHGIFVTVELGITAAIFIIAKLITEATVAFDGSLLFKDESFAMHKLETIFALFGEDIFELNKILLAILVGASFNNNNANAEIDKNKVGNSSTMIYGDIYSKYSISICLAMILLIGNYLCYGIQCELLPRYPKNIIVLLLVIFINQHVVLLYTTLVVQLIGNKGNHIDDEDNLDCIMFLFFHKSESCCLIAFGYELYTFYIVVQFSNIAWFYLLIYVIKGKDDSAITYPSKLATVTSITIEKSCDTGRIFELIKENKMCNNSMAVICMFLLIWLIGLLVLYILWYCVRNSILRLYTSPFGFPINHKIYEWNQYVTLGVVCNAIYLSGLCESHSMDENKFDKRISIFPNQILAGSSELKCDVIGSRVNHAIITYKLGNNLTNKHNDLIEMWDDRVYHIYDGDITSGYLIIGVQSNSHRMENESSVLDYLSLSLQYVGMTLIYTASEGDYLCYGIRLSYSCSDKTDALFLSVIDIMPECNVYNTTNKKDITSEWRTDSESRNSNNEKYVSVSYLFTSLSVSVLLSLDILGCISMSLECICKDGSGCRFWYNIFILYSICCIILNMQLYFGDLLSHLKPNWDTIRNMKKMQVLDCDKNENNRINFINVVKCNNNNKSYTNAVLDCDKNENAFKDVIMGEDKLLNVHMVQSMFNGIVSPSDCDVFMPHVRKEIRYGYGERMDNELREIKVMNKPLSEIIMGEASIDCKREINLLKVVLHKDMLLLGRGSLDKLGLAQYAVVDLKYIKFRYLECGLIKTDRSVRIEKAMKTALQTGDVKGRDSKVLGINIYDNSSQVKDIQNREYHLRVVMMRNEIYDLDEYVVIDCDMFMVNGIDEGMCDAQNVKDVKNDKYDYMVRGIAWKNCKPYYRLVNIFDNNEMDANKGHIALFMKPIGSPTKMLGNITNHCLNHLLRETWELEFKDNIMFLFLLLYYVSWRSEWQINKL